MSDHSDDRPTLELVNHPGFARHSGASPRTASRASARVVELFAFLHDAGRQDEWGDSRHREWSARLVTELGAATLCLSRMRSSCSRTPAFATATA